MTSTYWLLSRLVISSIEVGELGWLGWLGWLGHVFGGPWMAIWNTVPRLLEIGTLFYYFIIKL